MSETFTLKHFITHPNFALALFISVCCLLPLYCGSAVTIVACATIMSVYVMVLPEQFRDRSGSMMTATGMVTAMWIAAMVLTAMTLMGEVR